MPPVAESAMVYGMPESAPASEEVAITNPAAGVTVSVAEACALELLALVAVMITGVLLVTLGAV